MNSWFFLVLVVFLEQSVALWKVFYVSFRRVHSKGFLIAFASFAFGFVGFPGFLRFSRFSMLVLGFHSRFPSLF